MKAKIHSSSIVYRKMKSSGGTNESEEAFSSLDELFTQVLDTHDPYHVDRITITGEDGNGERQVVTFVFQSITNEDARAT